MYNSSCVYSIHLYCYTRASTQLFITKWTSHIYVCFPRRSVDMITQWMPEESWTCINNRSVISFSVSSDTCHRSLPSPPPSSLYERRWTILAVSTKLITFYKQSRWSIIPGLNITNSTYLHDEIGNTIGRCSNGTVVGLFRCKSLSGEFKSGLDLSLWDLFLLVNTLRLFVAGITSGMANHQQVR